MKNATVTILNCYSYNQNEVFEIIEKACLNANMPCVKGKSILVKPNILTDAKPEDCITTHPEVVRAVIRLLKKNGAAKIYCADSPGMPGPNFAGKNCMINQVCQEEGAIWCNFLINPDITPIDGTKQSLPLAHVLKDVDMVFSVCKFKTHQLMNSTGAVKNLFGLVPGLNKGPCHLKNPTKESFARLIVGIHQTVKPAFCIMDAVIGMEGPGPSNGTPRPVNLIMASDNCFAMDKAQSIIMNYRENEIPILNEARRRHIMPDNITYPFLVPEELIIEDFKRIPPKEKTHFFKSLILPYFTKGIQKKKIQKETPPTFINEKCIKCKRCINICPAHALKLEDKVVINTSKCIRCYCCHEMCPANAITIINQDS